MGIGNIGSSCFATGIVKFTVDVIRFGSATSLGVGAPRPDDPYYFLWVVGGLTIGAVLAVTLTRGKRK